MDDIENYSLIVICKHNLSKVDGLKIIKINNIDTVWIWCSDKIVVYETVLFSVKQRQQTLVPSSPQFENPNSFELTLKANIISVFHVIGNVIYVVDSSGSLYLVQPENYGVKCSTELMEVEDLFESPHASDSGLIWKESLVLKIINCDKIVNACQLRMGVAVLGVKEESLVLFVYSFPELKLTFIMEFDNFTFINRLNTIRGEVVTSCPISSLAPPLKQLFQEHLDVCDTEIILIGLTSGLVLWLCANESKKGPFVLCAVYQQVQEIYFIKGVCAMTAVPDSDALLAATIHGSVYIFDPTTSLSTTSSKFVFPDQSLLDNMFIQSQNLEEICKNIKEEDDIIKAVSTAAVANSIPNLFEVSLRLISGNEFIFYVKLVKTKIVFSQDLWLGCVDVANSNGYRKTKLCKLYQDFSSSFDLVLKVNHNLLPNDVVSVELVLFLENQQPIIIVPLDKIKIDACRLMVFNTPALGKDLSNSFENILWSLNNDSPKEKVQDCKLCIKMSSNINDNSVLLSICQDSFHHVSEIEKNQILAGKKHNLQLSINNVLVHLNWNKESQELLITCCDIQLCHQVKEAVIKRLSKSENKQVSETTVLDLQALHQTFEVEKLKDEKDFEALMLLQKKLRYLITSQLPI